MTNRKVSFRADAGLTTGVLPKRPPAASTESVSGVSPWVPPVGALFAGTYRIERCVEAGDMGALLIAWDGEQRREVAIKLVDPQLVSARSMFSFWDEARAVARFRHANVAEIYAFGERNGSPYVVMEHVSGEVGSSWIRGRQVSVEEATAIIDQLSEGVAALHDGGVAHGSLDWSCVRIGWHLRTRLADVGLARMLAGGRVRHTGMTEAARDVLSLVAMTFELVGEDRDGTREFAAELARRLAETDGALPLAVAAFREHLHGASRAVG